MPPFIHETVAWLRYFTRLPIPPVFGETIATGQPDLARTAHAVPVAGAIVGAAGAVALLVAWALRLPDLLSATLAIGALALVTGALGERGLAASAERIGKQEVATPGLAAVTDVSVVIVLALLLRIAALDGLLPFGTLAAGLALIAAGAVSRAAAMAVTLMIVPREPRSPETAPRPEDSALQRLAIVALLIGVAALLPAYGLAAALAGPVAAIGIAVLAAQLAPRLAADRGPPFAIAVEPVAEIAFLVAVLIFVGSL